MNTFERALLGAVIAAIVCIIASLGEAMIISVVLVACLGALGAAALSITLGSASNEPDVMEDDAISYEGIDSKGSVSISYESSWPPPPPDDQPA